MKKQLILAVIALAAMTFATVSCQKDDNPSNKTSNTLKQAYQPQHPFTIHQRRSHSRHPLSPDFLIWLIIISPLLSTVHYHLQRVSVLTALTTITGIVRNDILRSEDCLIVAHLYHRANA